MLSYRAELYGCRWLYQSNEIRTSYQLSVMALTETFRNKTQPMAYGGEQVAKGFMIFLIHFIIFHSFELKVVWTFNFFQFQQRLDAKSHNLFLEHSEFVKFSNELQSGWLRQRGKERRNCNRMGLGIPWYYRAFASWSSFYETQVLPPVLLVQTHLDLL